MSKINISLIYYVVYSCFAFLFSSVVVFSTVAFGERNLYKFLGFWGAYLFWIILFVLLGGFLLYRLVKRFMTLWQFYMVYFVTFFSYSCAWILCYVVVRGYRGEWVGGIVGSIVFAFSWSLFFKMMNRFLAWTLIFCFFHCGGYFLGNYCNAAITGALGMMWWGIFYGLGVGIGLGVILYEVKENKVAV